MRSRFVRPETTTLKISLGDTLIVKRRLNMGEQRDVLARMATSPTDGGVVRANPFEIGISMVLAYLVDWSICDEDGTHVDIFQKPREEVRAILNELDPLDFDEIRLAVDKHVEVQDKLHETEKKDRDGRSESPATSPSPDAAAGDMNGSPNSTLMSTTSS
jgi:hypothetical protein